MKYTAELAGICEKIWRDGFDKGVDGRDDLPEFKSFFPEDKIKETPSLSELSTLPFNSLKCEARIEKHGFGIQCSRSPFEGGCLCKKHRDMFAELPDGKDLPYGRYNKEKPKFYQDRENVEEIKWDGEERQAKKISKSSQKKKKSDKPKLKVGEMRIFLSSRLPNTAFKGLKKPELTALYLEEKEKENISSSDDENSPPPEAPVAPEASEASGAPEETEETEETEAPVEPEASEAPEAQEETEAPEGTEAPVEPEAPEETEGRVVLNITEEENTVIHQNVGSSGETYEVEIHQNNPENYTIEKDDGRGTGLNLVPKTPKSVPEFKELFKTLGIDTENVKGLRGYKQRYEEYLKEMEGTDTEDMSDDELKEDKSEFVELDYEGVSYLEDEDSGEIYNLKYKKVGKWDADGDDIIWNSEEFQTEHETSRP